MLGDIAVTINANSSSTITSEGQKVAVCNYTGYVDQNGTPNTTRTIRNKDLYMANREECDADFESFTDYLFSLIDTN